MASAAAPVQQDQFVQLNVRDLAPLLYTIARSLDATVSPHTATPHTPPAHTPHSTTTPAQIRPTPSVPDLALPTASTSRAGGSLFPAPVALRAAPSQGAPSQPSLILPNGAQLPPAPAELSSRQAGKLPMAARLAAHRAERAAAAVGQAGAGSESPADESRLPPVPEHLLIQDVVWLLQGINGTFVRFKKIAPPSGDPRRPYRRGMIVTDDLPAGEEAPGERDARLEVGIEFVLDETGYSLPAPTRILLHQLVELGWLYRRIDAVIGKDPKDRNLVSAKKRAQERTIGMVEQSLYAALEKEMTDYAGLWARLKAELKAMEEGEALGPPGASGLEGGLTLRRLGVWTGEMRLRMRLMATLVEEAGEHNAGGALLTSLHARTSNGDPFIRAFSAKLLTALSVPFFATLAGWIYEGELKDVCNEFFVELNPAVITGPAGAVDEEGDSFGLGREGEENREGRMAAHELWEEKFRFRKEMLPGFLEESFGRKIFSTGKSLNFLKYSCQDSGWVVERHFTTRTLEYSDMAGLEQSISLAYSDASERLFSLFVSKFRLLEHLSALKDYLMLGKGDFVEILIETLGPSLAKPANTLYRHDLTATLETALKGSTSTKKHPDILRRLDARMLEFTQGELGWDVFTLSYQVEPPLDTILSPQAMGDYLRMFKHLWQIKRVEYALGQIWRRLMTGARTFLRVKELGFDFHQTRISLGEMIFFIRQVQYYCHLEVIGCSWQVLEDFINAGKGDLDALIEAHQQYLKRLTSKALLQGGRKSKRAHSGESLSMLDQLRKVFTVVLHYREAADALCNHALAEAARQESYRDVHRGIESPLIPPRLEQTNPEQLYAIRERLAGYAGEFRELAVALVTGLGQAPDLDMRFLAVRLNFNFAFVNPNAKQAEAQAPAGAH